MDVKLFVGTSGWSYNHWIKRFYPAKLERRKWLEFYCKHFTAGVNNNPTTKKLGS
jgi:uncharacterized protein YecE (DUF72 family)